jgi:hypothetical protein
MSLVSENMEQFRRNQKTKPTLGLGMRVKIKNWLEEKDFKRYNILDDLTVDLKEKLDLQHGAFIDKPDYVN